MTAHTTALDVSRDQPPLPNQHFSSWLRGQTTLFISQIAALLGIVLFLAEEVYYVSHFREHSELLEPLTIKLIVDCAHVAFMAVFILVLIQVLDDNERGSYRVKLVHERVFGKHGGDYESDLRDGKEQLKKFKRRFLWFWIGMLFLYVFFACQHSYDLATRHPEPAAQQSARGAKRTPPNAGKKSDDGKESFEAEVKYDDAGRVERFEAERSPEGAAGSSAEGSKQSASQLLDMREVRLKLAFPFIVFFFNNFTLMFVFWCFLIMWIPSGEMGKRYYKYRNGSILVVGVLTLLFPALAYLKGEGHTPGEWDAFIAVFDALSGVINAVALALLVARLDSKLIGLPSWLISTLYSYAAVQPLFMVFSLNQSRVLEKIATSVLIFVFVSKIYFFLIIIYALQTGKMLNYLFCFPILRRWATLPVRPAAARPKYWGVRPESSVHETLRLTVLAKLRWAEAVEPGAAPPILEGSAAPPARAPDEPGVSRITRILARLDKWSRRRLGRNEALRVRRARERASRWLRSNSPLTVSKWLGLAAVCFFFGSLIVSVPAQNDSLLFRADDLTDPAGFAVKMRVDQSPLSLYLWEKFSTETRRLLGEYNGSVMPEPLKKALAAELNKALGDEDLFDERRFAQFSLPEEVRDLGSQRPQGDALLRFNRSLLERAYPKEIAEINHGVEGGEWNARAVLNVVIDCAQLVVVLGIIVTVYLLRRENRYGARGALVRGRRVFGEAPELKYPPEGGKKQLRKFKEYFLYFWCATFLLYVVFLLDHLEIVPCVDGNGFVALTSKILRLNRGCLGAPAQGSAAHMLKVLLYPFLEFSMGTLNLMLVFWCFVVLRSPAFDRRAVVRQKMLVNHSAFGVALLVAVFPLLLFWIGGPKLLESNMRDYATVFNGLTGTLSAIVLALLIARMDSSLFGLPSWAIGMLFAYASIQPLVVAFALNDTVLKMVQTSVLVAALGLKICFFLIIAHSLQSGRALNYLVCFPFLKERVNSIFENQFEIRLAGGEAHPFTVLILKKNRLYYSTGESFKSRSACDRFVSYLRKRMKEQGAYRSPEPASGTHWVEVRSLREDLLCESVPLRTAEEARDLIAESMEKIPYCKYNRT